MSLTHTSPYVTTGKIAQDDEPNNITDSIRTTVSDSETNTSDDSAQTVGSSLTSVSLEENDRYVREEDCISHYMNEAETTGTASPSSPTSMTISRRASGSQSAVSSIGDDCINEHVSHPDKDLTLEQRTGTEGKQLPGTIRVDPIESVFTQDLPVLSTTVS